MSAAVLELFEVKCTEALIDWMNDEAGYEEDNDSVDGGVTELVVVLEEEEEEEEG